MPKQNIVNIVNFLRTVEPRESYSLIEPVQKQLALLKKHRLPHTFLLQYDCLLDSEYLALMQTDFDPSLRELGVWLEIVQPLAEAAGIPWRGRFPVWDWHANVGFSVGYTPAEREKLIDVLFERFREVYGAYPRVMGSWTIDAHTLDYAVRRYGLDASCNCKDQWGTDGYTVWGGYWNGAYYPAKCNMFSPAQSEEAQIPVPVFRMLGSDPIYQYDEGLSLTAGAAKRQSVITLEPSCKAGADKKWIDWYFDTMFSGECLAYAYTQAGQENAFGWARMKDGLPYQFERLTALREAGKITVEPLGESGRSFKRQYRTTPATAVSARSDWQNKGRQSIWYLCKNYRCNLFAEKNRFRIRDIYLFDENYEERYLTAAEPSPVLHFDNLPVIDGNRMSGHGILAGLYFDHDGKELTFDALHYEEPSEDTLLLTLTGTACGTLTLRLSPDSIQLRAEADFTLRAAFDPKSAELPQRVAQTEKMLTLSHSGYEYALALEKGIFAGTDVLAQDGEVLLRMRGCGE